MFEQIVVDVLNRTLGQYISNLKHDQLNLQIWKGHVTLYGCQVRADVFQQQSDSLPLIVKEGSIGAIELQIPWANLKNRPVVVTLKDLQVVVEPVQEIQHLNGVAGSSALQYKKSRLASSELVQQPQQQNPEKQDEHQANFIESLVTKIVDNLQVSIQNISLTYLHVDGSRVVVKLDELSAVSTDQNFQAQFIGATQRCIYKLAKLRQFQVYFDVASGPEAKEDETEHQYILHPVNATSQITANKKQPQNQTDPKYLVQGAIDEFNVSLDDTQWDKAHQILMFFSQLVKAKKYAKFRAVSLVGASPLNMARRRWHYAIECVRNDVHQQRFHSSWPYFKWRRDMRIEYVKLYKVKMGYSEPLPLQQENSNIVQGSSSVAEARDAILKRLEHMESQDDLSYEDIRYFRSVAIYEGRKELKARKKKQQVKEGQQVGSPISKIIHNNSDNKGGWFSWIWPGGSKQSDQQLTGGVLTEEQRQALYDAIDFKESDVAELDMDTVDDSHIKFKVQFELKRGVMALLNTSMSNISSSKVIQVDMTDLDVVFAKLTSSFSIAASLGDLSCFNEVGGTQKLISAKQNTERENFFEMEYMTFPPLQTSSTDAKFSMTMRPLEFLYLPRSIPAITHFFDLPSDEDVEWRDGLRQGFQSQLEQMGKGALSVALEGHKSIDMKIDLSAPLILVPLKDWMFASQLEIKKMPHYENVQSFVERSGYVQLVVDLGHVLVTSQVLSRDAKDKIGQQVKDMLEADLEQMMYDRFILQLQDLQLFLDTVQGESNRDECWILPKTDMTLNLDLSILPKAVNLSRVRVGGDLPSLQIHFSEEKWWLIEVLLTRLSQDFSQGSPPGVVIPQSVIEEKSNVWIQGMTLTQKSLMNFDDNLGDDMHESTVSSSDVHIVPPTPMQGSIDLNAAFDRNLTAKSEICRLELSIASLRLIIKSTASGNVCSLADLTLSDASVSALVRQYDISANMQVRALAVKDLLLEKERSFGGRYLLNSALKEGDNPQQDSDDLAHISFVQVDRQHPDFYTKYDGLDMLVQLNFGTLLLNINQLTILKLYELMLVSFTVPGATSGQNDSAKVDSSGSDETTVTKVEMNSQVSAMKFVFTMKSFFLNLVSKEDVMFGSAALTQASISVVLTEESSMQVNVGVGSISMRDLLTRKPDQCYFELVRMKGGIKLFDVIFESFSKQSHKYPGYDSKLTIRGGSLQITYLQAFQSQFLLFINNFTTDLLQKAQSIAMAGTEQVQNADNKMKFDIEIESPVVVLPLDISRPDAAIMKVGDISLQSNAGENLVSVFDIALKSIGIQTVKSFKVAGKRDELPLLKSFNLDICLTFPLANNLDDKLPAVSLKLKSTALEFQATQSQCVLLIDLYNMLTSSFQSKSNDPPTDGQVSQTTPVEVQVKSEKVVFDGDFQIPSISVNLIQDSNATLTVASVNSINAAVQTKLDSSLVVSSTIQNLVLKDSRHVKTQFRDIVPPSFTSKQRFFELEYTVTANKDAMVLLSVHEPSLYLQTDYMLDLRSYAFNVLSRIESTPTQQVTTPTKPDVEDLATSGSFSFRFTVDGVKIFMLRDATQTDTDAILLTVDQVVMAQESIFSLAVSQVALKLCYVNNWQESSVLMISEFDTTFIMDNRLTGKEYDSSSVLSLDVPLPLVLRISYHDIAVVMQIFNKAVAGTSQTEKSVQQLAPTKITSTTVKAIETQPKPSQILSVKKALEKAHISLKGLRLILIDDLSNLHLPMFDVLIEGFQVVVSDWSSSLNAKCKISAQISYFNIKNSHWEPVLEPFEIKLSVQNELVSQKMKFICQNDRRLEIDISQNLLETCVFIQKAWIERQNQPVRFERSADAPYVIRNETGYPIVFWEEGRDMVSDLSEVQPYDQMPFRFDDWRKMREELSPKYHRISVQIKNSGWETLRNVQVDREDVNFYPLRPSIKTVNHCLVCEVRLDGNVKVVTLRSTLTVENNTLVNLEIVTLDSNGNYMSPIQRVSCGQKAALPIESAYHYDIKVRPDSQFAYTWSLERLIWRDLIKHPTMVATCQPESLSGPNFMLVATAIQVEQLGQQRHKKAYPLLNIQVSPPLEIENLLPYDLSYSLFDKDSKQQFSGALSQGESVPIHSISLNHVIGLRVGVAAAGYASSDLAIINNPGDSGEDHHIHLLDSSSNELRLKLVYLKSKSRRFKSRKIAVICPYVVVNKTSLNLMFKTRALLANRDFTSASSSNTTGNDSVTNEIKPIMFAFSQAESFRGRVHVKSSDSDYSRALSFDAVGRVDVVRLPKRNGHVSYLGCDVTSGVGKFNESKIIVFTPRYIVKNNLTNQLELRTSKVQGSLIVGAKQSCPLYDMHEDADTLMSVRLPGSHDQWSAPVNFNNLGKVYVKVLKSSGQSEILLRLEMLLEGSTIFIVVGLEETHWPYRIDNTSSTDVIVHQYQARPRYKIGAGQSMLFTWDEPALQDKLLMTSVQGYEREVNIQELGPLIPMRYMAGKEHGILGMDVVAEGPTLVLKIKDWHESDSIYRQKRKSVKQSNEEFEVVDANVEVKTQIDFQLAGIGVSVIGKNFKEIIYVTLKDVWISIKDTAINQSFGLNIGWIQIDNQTYGAMDPIILYPSLLQLDSPDKEKSPPMFQSAVVKSKDTSYGVEYFKYFTLLLQEVTIELEEEFLLELLAVFRLDMLSAFDIEDKLWDGRSDIPEPASISDGSKMYFEVLEVQPVKFNLTFARSERGQLDAELSRSHNPLMFIVNVFTMTVGNITEAHLRLNAIILEHPIFTVSTLLSLVQKHYTQEVIGQLHKIIGSADFLGNPVGLFSTIGSGVKDVFYEPYLGFVSDRPQDFGIGLAKGASSFVRKTVYGFSDTLSKVTSSVGKGLASATMDSEFQEQRRALKTRNHPRHAVKGVTAGASSFARSIASGVTGLVEQPIRGASEQGVGGFFKGVGKGLVGLVTKPVVGVFDLTSNVSEGIRNTATFKDKEIDRMRLPRHISNGIVKPYSGREAFGATMLQEVAIDHFPEDEYVAHLDLRTEDIIILVTKQRIMAVRAGRSHLEWQIPLDELQHVQLTAQNIIKIQTFNGQKVLLPCPDQRTSEWLLELIQETLDAFVSESRLWS